VAGRRLRGRDVRLLLAAEQTPAAVACHDGEVPPTDERESDEPIWSALRFVRRPWILSLAAVLVLQRAGTVMLDARSIWVGVSVAVGLAGVVTMAVAVASLVGDELRGRATRVLAVAGVISAAVAFGAIVLFNTDLAALLASSGVRRATAMEVQTFGRLLTAGVGLAGVLLLARCLLRLLERAP
jgi:hypothetical protein